MDVLAYSSRLIAYRCVIDLINSSHCLKVWANYQSCHCHDGQRHLASRDSHSNAEAAAKLW